MNTTLTANIINNFEEIYKNEESILDCDDLTKRAYHCYIEMVQNVSEEYHHCIGCPVIRRTYRLNNPKLSTEEYFSVSQEECIHNELTCAIAASEIDMVHSNSYEKLLCYADELES